MGEDDSSLTSTKQHKWRKHYSDFHKILLVGEGDFSFALCLAKSFGSAANIVAISLDSQQVVKAMYSKGESNLKELQEMGCTVIHEVDAHSMAKHPLLRHRYFDRIVFNFPHAPLVWREHDMLQIGLHQEVVRGFMRNACEMLSLGGEVHVTHKTAYPFRNWEIEKLAEAAGLHNFIGQEEFYAWEYPGYTNKKGYGRWDDSFPVGQCSTFKFALF